MLEVYGFIFQELTEESWELEIAKVIADGNVVGMMPHPERAVEKLLNPLDNKPSSLIFESLIHTIGAKN